MTWHTMDTAPKDGTPIELHFKGGWSNIRSGQEPRRLIMDGRIRVGKWWTAADALKAVGKKKSTTGSRGALIAKAGGYWGSAGKHSKPMSGIPTHWRPLLEVVPSVVYEGVRPITGETLARLRTNYKRTHR